MDLQIDRIAVAFEQAWQKAPPEPSIDDFLQAEGVDRVKLLAELVQVDLEQRLTRGEATRIEEYLGRYPELSAAAAHVVSLAAFEFRLRQGSGNVRAEEFFARFPEHVPALRQAFGLTAVTSPGLAIRLNCPHCNNPIELVTDAREDEVVCPSCGSSFHLDAEHTRTWNHDTLPKLGKFELLSRIGAGAFGTVYKAFDSELKRTVALKLPRSGSLIDSADEDLFLREARNAAQLRHSGIVPVFEVGRSEQFPYIVSELVDGITLADALTGRRFSFRESARLVQQLAEALDYSHRQGVVHRDLKPSNIMLAADDTPRIMDFGLAKRDAGEITMTIDGQVLGTPAYMSPEQASGQGHHVDGRSDVYSLGVILYELLTGELPFRGNQRMLLHQVLHDEPRAPRSLNDRVPRDLETICLKAMAKEPSRRNQSAASVSADLGRYLNGEPIEARPVGRLERSWRWCKRNRAAAAFIGTGCLFVTVLSIGGPVIAHREAQAAKKEASLREAQIAAIRQTRDLVMRNMDVLENDAQLNRPEFQELRVQLLKETSRTLDEINNILDLPGDVDVWQSMADAHYAVARQHETRGALVDATAGYRTAADFLRLVAEAKPGDLDALHSYASCMRQLETLQNRIGDHESAMQNCEIMVGLYERLADAKPEEFRVELGYAYDNFGTTYQELGRVAEAREQTLRGLAILQDLVAEQPDNVEYQRGLAYFYNNLASQATSVNQLDDAVRNHREALRVREAIVARDLTDNSRYVEFKTDLARTKSRLADILMIQGNLVEAASECQAAYDTLQAILALNPTFNAYHEQLADCCVIFSDIRIAEGKYSDVPQIVDAGIQSLDYLERPSPPSRERIIKKGRMYDNATLAYSQLGQFDAMQEAAGKAVGAWRTLLNQGVAMDDGLRVVVSRGLRYWAAGQNSVDGREDAKRDIADSKELLSAVHDPAILMTSAENWANAIVEIDKSGAEEGQKLRAHFVDAACDTVDAAMAAGLQDGSLLDNPRLAVLKNEPRFQAVVAQFRSAAAISQP